MKACPGVLSFGVGRASRLMVLRNRESALFVMEVGSVCESSQQAVLIVKTDGCVEIGRIDPILSNSSN
jgi:hypothetical protein